LTARSPRKNVSRRSLARQRRRWLDRLAVGFWTLTGAAGVVFTSLLFIFIYEVLTQTDHFRARHIAIEGGQRLSAQALAEIAGVHIGVNLLKINLSAAQRHLLAHPWIAEAALRWEVPSSLYISVREHEPVAIVDMGKKFLLNGAGEIFKEWEPSDPTDLPVVRGLNVSDLRLADRSGAAPPLAWPWFKIPSPPPAPSRPMEAVMEILSQAAAHESALPLRHVQTIQVDRELGLTVEANAEAQTIRLGYNEYGSKLRLLSDLMGFMKTQSGLAGFQRIDLTDTNRVIVNPVKTEAAVKPSPKGG
jgi:cell division protein FtsQ